MYLQPPSHTQWVVTAEKQPAITCSTVHDVNKSSTPKMLITRESLEKFSCIWEPISWHPTTKWLVTATVWVSSYITFASWTSIVLPWWRLEHSVKTSASYFPSSASWYQITFSSFMQKSTEKPYIIKWLTGYRRFTGEDLNGMTRQNDISYHHKA